MNRNFTWINKNKWTLLVFWLILFRPQILAVIRIHIVKPMEHRFHPQGPKRPHGLKIECKKRPANYNDGYQFTYVALIRLPSGDDENTDDGCGNSDNGDCSSSDNSGDSSDNSSGEGCSDTNDESCASDNSNYDQGDTDYSDDGCDCSGAAIVGSSAGSGSGLVHHSHITGRVTTGYYFNLYIKDVSGNILIYLARNTYSGGTFSYSWTGYYGVNQFVTDGTYMFVLETAFSLYLSTSQSFTYSSQYGFQAAGTTGNTVDLGL